MNPSPTERLAVSREHLRLALQAQGGPGAPGAGDARSSTDRAGLAGLAGLQSLPAVGVVIEALGLWWDRHPLRATGRLAAEAAKVVIAPLAQRHPLWLVGGAFALGGLVAWTRPWRWGLKSALFAGLLPQLLVTSLAHWQRHVDTTAQASVRPSKNA